MKRVFLIVLDSFGLGEMPDANLFGDKDCNTLKRISLSEKFSMENLIELGFGNIDGVDLPKKVNHKSILARLSEASMGKDTTIGHWEIAGIESKKPFPTYPNGFPEALLSEFSKRIKRDIICNKPYSGTKVIEDYGAIQRETGALIVYTSADSVFQIAADEDIIPLEELYRYCLIARELLKGEHSVGRVIARPYVYRNGKYMRTANRKDFSLKPTKKTVLDAIKEEKMDVISVGKINDIFASCGITHSIPSHSNKEGMEISLGLLNKDFKGLAFINLVDFDMLYGHRQDIDGYAKAISEFDEWLPSFIKDMKDDDILIITADHGCDPGDSSTDHTREYTPLIIYGNNIKSKNCGTLKGFYNIAATISDYLQVPYECDGKSLI